MKITYSEWIEKYKPIDNGRGGHGFDTHDDWEKVNSYPRNQVWTLIDDEGTAIVAGLWRINRLEYYITAKPWEDENIYV